MRDEIAFLLGDAEPAGSPELTTEALGELLGVHRRTVLKLAADGLVVQLGQNAFDRDSSVRRYCEHLRKQAAGRGGSATLTDQRTRLAREQADAVAFKNAAARRELIPATEIEKEWAAVLRDIRAAMLALPSRIQQKHGSLTAHDVAVMDREIRDALTEVADARD